MILRCLVLILASFTAFAAQDPVRLPVKFIPKTLDTRSLEVADASWIANLIAEKLVTLGPSFQIVPALAERFTWKKPGLHLHIRLATRTFSDGSPVTSRIVIENLERCIRGAESVGSLSLTRIAGYAEFIKKPETRLKGLRVLSDREFEIETTESAPLLLDDLSHASCSIVKPSVTGSSDLFQGAIGSGPYAIKSRSDARVDLIRNPHYVRVAGPEAIAFIQFADYGDAEKAAKAFDLAIGSDGQLSGFNKYPYASIGSLQLILNVSAAPFDKVEVRKAVYQGLNPKSFIENLGWPQSHFQRGYIPFGIPGFKPRASRDVAGAKQILASLGYTTANPLRFEVWISKGPQTAREKEVWEKHAFSGLPIHVTAREVVLSEVWASVKEGRFTALRITRYPGTVDGHRMLSVFHSASKFNLGHFRSKRCDSEIERAIGTFDFDARLKAYDRADECLIKEAGILPLTSVPPGYAFVRKPWRLDGRSRFTLNPYDVGSWRTQ